MNEINSINAIVIMGVSGSGKSTVGALLAADLGWPFFDADDYHPPANIIKMASGQPLNDADRAPWLAILHDLIALHIRAQRPIILAASALKQTYRDQMSADNPGTLFVYLKGDFETIWARMSARPDHFMKPAMLHSQFDTLETSPDLIAIEIDRPPLDLVTTIINMLPKRPHPLTSH